MEKAQKAQKVVLNPRKMLVLAVMGFTQGAIFLMPYMTSAFYDPFLQVLGVNNTQLGVLMSVYGVITMFAALPGGWLADKFDTKKLIMLCMLFTGVMGIVAAFFMNYRVYIALWALFAIIGNLMYWSAGLKTVRFVGDEHEQGKAYGYFNAFNFGFNSLFNLVGVAILAGFAASSFLGLKYIFLFFSLLCFLSALLVWLFVASIKPKELQSDDAGDKIKNSTLKDMLFVLKHKEVWLFAAVGFCCYSILGVSTYFTPYFGDVMHLDVASAAIIYVLTGPVSIIFGPVFGILSDWMRSTIKLITFLMLITSGLLAVMLIFTDISLPAAIAIDALVVLTGGGAYTIMFACIEEIGLDRKYAGICIGLITIIAYSPDTFMYILFGHWLDTYGNNGYFGIFGYSAALSLIAVLAGWYMYHSAVKRKKSIGLQRSSHISYEHRDD